jgi:hypothetical protein
MKPSQKSLQNAESMEASIKIKFCIFQNRHTKQYKWLSLECSIGTNDYRLYESTDIAELPSQKPSDCTMRSSKYLDYENAVNLICCKGYDIVTQE